MYGTVGASARWQAHYAQILKGHSFVQGLSNLALFVRVERDVRLLVHGDDFMVEMPTHEEKWFEGVLFSKYDGKCTEKFHSDGNILTETSFLNCVIRWDPASGRAELEADRRARCKGASRSGIGKVVSCCDSCGQASEVGRTSAADRSATSDRRGYHVVQVSYDACKLLVSGPSRLVICCRLPGTRDEKSHDEGPRGTQTCWTLLERATSWSNCVCSTNLAWSSGGIL